MPGKKTPGPSVKDPDQYEARCATRAPARRRRPGSPTRIAPRRAKKGGRSSAPTTTGRRTTSNKRAAEIGIEGRSDMSKNELIDALRNHSGCSITSESARRGGRGLQALRPDRAHPRSGIEMDTDEAWLVEWDDFALGPPATAP